MRRLLIGLVATGLWGQVPAVDFEREPPPRVPTNRISAQVTGVGGTQTYFYWIVATYPIGDTFPGGPVRVNDVADNLGAGNFVTVRWPLLAGALTYDVLRTTTPQYPSGVANVLVAGAVAGPAQADIANAVGAYTLASAARADGFLRLNNQAYAVPEFEMQPGLNIFGNLTVTGLVTIPLLGLTQGSVLFADALGGIGEDNATFFWDDVNDNLGLGTNTPGADLDITVAAGTATMVLEGTSSSISLRDNAASDYLFLSAAGDLTIQEEGVAIRISIEDSGSIGLGTGNNVPTGTVDILDRIAAVGATLVQVGWDGTNVSATSTRLEVREGTVQGLIDPFEVVGPAGATYFMVEAQTGRIGIETVNPTADVHIHVASGVADMIIESDDDIARLAIDAITDSILTFPEGSAARWAIGRDDGADTFRIAADAVLADATTVLAIDIGTLAVCIGPGNIAPTVTADFLDRTAITGTTLVQVGWDGVNTSAVSSQLVVRGGTVQGVVNLQEWREVGGGLRGSMTIGGTLNLASTVASLGATWAIGTAVGGVALSTGFGITFTANTNHSIGIDLGLDRNAAGVLEVNSGTAGKSG